jgi:hypothetical protein
MDCFYLIVDSEAHKHRVKENSGNSFTTFLTPAIDNLNHDLEMAVVDFSAKSECFQHLSNQTISCDIIEKYQSGAGYCHQLRTFFLTTTTTTTTTTTGGVQPIEKSPPPPAPAAARCQAAATATAEGMYSFFPLQYYPVAEGVFDSIHIQIQPLYEHTLPAELASNRYKPAHVVMRLHFRKKARSAGAGAGAGVGVGAGGKNVRSGKEERSIFLMGMNNNNNNNN